MSRYSCLFILVTRAYGFGLPCAAGLRQALRSTFKAGGAALVAISLGGNLAIASEAPNQEISHSPSKASMLVAGIDAFEAAGKALTDPRMKMKSLSGNDFELVQKGEKALSDAPRASKRRAMQFCRDGGKRSMYKTGKKALFGEETISEKDCINRVMSDDFKFILDAVEGKTKKK